MTGKIELNLTVDWTRDKMPIFVSVFRRWRSDAFLSVSGVWNDAIFLLFPLEFLKTSTIKETPSLSFDSSTKWSGEMIETRSGPPDFGLSHGTTSTDALEPNSVSSPAELGFA